MAAAILLGMEAARLLSCCTWMLEQVLAISPFNCTRLVGRLLLMRLFITFHTSSIMFRSGRLAVQSSTWMLRSCSHVLTFFVHRSQILLKIMPSSLYRCHTDRLWMKEGDWLSNTSIHTSAVTVDLRKTILPILLVDTQPHTITEVGNFTNLFKKVGL